MFSLKFLQILQHCSYNLSPKFCGKNCHCPHKKIAFLKKNTDIEQFLKKKGQTVFHSQGMIYLLVSCVMCLVKFWFLCSS